jgi:hypothetical protein
MDCLFTLDNILFRVNLFKNWDAVGSSLTSAVLGSGQNVFSSERDRYAGFLDRGRLFPAFLENTHQQFSLQTKLFKLVAPCVSHILHEKHNLLLAPSVATKLVPKDHVMTLTLVLILLSLGGILSLAFHPRSSNFSESLLAEECDQ